jgi:hypothetical protein
VALVVAADEVFIHCAKAFRRSRLWDPTTWDPSGDAPDGADILEAQGHLGDVAAAQVRDALEDSYRADLAADAPQATLPPNR